MGYRRSLRVLSACAVATVMLTATSVGASPQAAKPKSGGTMTILKSTESALGQDPIAYLGHPSTAAHAGQDFAIYDYLFLLDATTLQLVPRLGLSLTSSSAGTIWTLKLRPNVSFSDGTKLDAEAVKFNWLRVADPVNKAPTASAASVIQTMDVIDPVTLRIALKTADPAWDLLVAGKLAWIGSPTAIKALGANYGKTPVGAGPFVLKEWIRDSQYTLVRNPSYWEKGRPYLDQLIFKVIVDANSAYTTLKSGGANIDYVYDPEVANLAKQDGYRLVPWIPNGGGQTITMNNTKAPFTDARVRKAIDLAIDRQQFVKTRRASSKDFLMTSVERPGTLYSDSKIAAPKYDLPAAQKLIDQVVAEQGGKPVTFTLNVFTTGYLQSDGELVQAMLAKLKNVEVKLEPLAPTAGTPRFNAGDFQAFSLGSPRWVSPTSDLISNFSTGNSSNVSRYSNPKVDAIFTELKAETDQKKRVDLVHAAEKQILADSPVAWFTRIVHYQVIDKSVRDYESFETIPLLDRVWLGGKT
jgi:peptide/nickel transport system substrate-binding protein